MSETQADSPRDLLIDVRDVSKCYHLYARPHDRLLQSIFRGRKRFYRDFWSLRDVSLQVRRGETIGIVGRNGAGKSTLLQLIAGTLQATSGRIKVSGRVAALLQLGSGFNPEFAGRENVYLNGSILGLSRAEIDRRYDEIVAFAEIGDFIDQPVKTYSSGMVMRLAFAVSVCLEPEILIVDEVLAVGDMLFQMKCFRRLKALKESGASILFVSHDLSTVRSFCDRALYLKEGATVAYGDVNEVVRRYEFDCFEEKSRPLPETAATARVPAKVSTEEAPAPEPAANAEGPAPDQEFAKVAARGLRQGTRKLEIVGCHLTDASGYRASSIAPDEEATVHFLVRANTDFSGDFHASMQINEKNGTQIAVLRDSFFTDHVTLTKGHLMTVSMRFVPGLRQGDYYGSLGILCFPAGRKYVNGAFNLQELELADHIDIGLAFEVKPYVRHLIPTPVLIESKLKLSPAPSPGAPQ